jgi:hypothetical protein
LKASLPSTDTWDVDLVFGEDWRVAKERRDAAEKTWSASKSSPANSISLAFPTSLTFDPDGNLASVDRESKRVFLLDSDGQMTRIRQKQSSEYENCGHHSLVVELVLVCASGNGNWSRANTAAWKNCPTPKASIAVTPGKERLPVPHICIAHIFHRHIFHSVSNKLNERLPDPKSGLLRQDFPFCL